MLPEAAPQWIPISILFLALFQQPSQVRRLSFICHRAAFPFVLCTMAYLLLEVLRRLFQVILTRQKPPYTNDHLCHISHKHRSIAAQHRLMKKPAKFVAYDFARRKAHTIATPPAKIQHYRVLKRAWAGKQFESAKTTRGRKGSTLPKRLISTAAEVLQYTDPEWQCLHCEKFGDDPMVSQPLCAC